MFLKSINVKEMVKFNDDKIEPLCLKEKNQEKLMLIAIQKGQILPTHLSQIDASIFVISGKIEVSAENNKHEIEENCVFSVPSNMLHSVKGLEDSYFFVLRM